MGAPHEQHQARGAGVKSIGDIRAAVVGTGFIGVVHVEALRRLGVEVTGVVGSSPERAAEKPGLPAPYPSFEAMLEDDRVEVVHLTTPNHLHYEQVRAVLAAGKHVVCEKPLAMDSTETAELLRLAEESGLVHAVNFNIRFYAQCQEARARVAAGEIGDVRLVSGGYLQDWLLYDTDWNWRLDPALGGSLRAVGDIGSHWLDLVTFVTGRHVEAVMADLTTFIPVRRKPTGPVETFTGGAAGETVDAPMETEDAAGILLRFEGGARGVLTVSQVSAGRKNRLSWEIDGSESALAWASEAPEELWIGRRDRPSEIMMRERGDYPPGHPEGFPDTFKALYRAVYGAVAAGGPPSEPDYPTFADGHEEALIGDAIARSHADRRWVTVNPVPQEV
jgi:predicted dehydrogenase